MSFSINQRLVSHVKIELLETQIDFLNSLVTEIDRIDRVAANLENVKF